MVTKVLVVDVKDHEVDELDAKLQSVGVNMQKVEGNTKETNNELKKLRDNGGAISTLDSLTGGWATRIKDAAEATDLFNGKLRLTRGALIATGIGAFVVALGVIVAYWDDIVEFITQTNKKLEQQIQLQQRVRDALSTELEILEAEQALLEAQGVSTEEIRQKRIQILETLLSETEAQLTNLEIQQKQLINESLRVTFLERALSAINKTPPIPTISEEEQTRLDEVQGKINELRKLVPQLQLDLLNLNTPKASGNGQESRNQVEGVETLPLTGLSEDALKDRVKLEAKILEDGEALITASQKRYAEERRQARIAELESKDEMIQAEANLLSQFSGLLAVFGEENKALAVGAIVTEQIASAARVISNTGVANAKAIAASPLTGGQPWVTFNTVSAALSIATSAAAAAKAISQLGGSGSGGTFSTDGAGASTPPAFNIVDSTPENQLNNALLSNEVSEVIVTEGQVTNAQEARRKKVAATSF